MAERALQLLFDAGAVITDSHLVYTSGKHGSAYFNNVPIFALIDIPLDAYSEAECPLCADGVPINTDVGKGREFLRRNSDRFYICPNPECRGLADWIDKDRGIFSCRRCDATTAAMEFE